MLKHYNRFQKGTSHYLFFQEAEFMAKKFWSMILAIVMLASVFAMSGIAEELSGTITISTLARPGSVQGWTEVIKAYTEMHPNVNIVLDLKPEDGYAEWITNITRTENPVPDIGEFDWGDYTSAKMIDWADYLDLDSPYSDGTWGEQFDPSGVIATISGNLEKVSFTSTQVMWMYNKEIFEKVGVEPPKTWDELVTVCEKLYAAGYQPIAIDGDYHSYSARCMSWLVQIYIDQVNRPLINVVRAQEGDYCYDPDIDGVWEYDPTDPWNDDVTKVTQNLVRIAKALYEGEDWRMDTVGAKTIWSNFAKVFPKYVGGEAWFATDADGMSNAFYQGKAAMMVNGGWEIVTYMRTMEEFAKTGYYENAEGEKVEGNVFTLGTFPMPTMEGEGIVAKVRTIEVPTIGLMAISKSQEHNDLVADFMMYYSSKEGMSKYMNAMLENGGSVDGPSYVYGVEYPANVASAFENVEYIGNAQKGYLNVFAKGVPLIDESCREFYNDAYEFFMGKITVDELLARSQVNLEKYLPFLLPGLGISVQDLENPANAPVGY